MTGISRRNALILMFATSAAMSALAIGAARADTPGPDVPTKKPTPGGGSGLKAHFTAADRDMNRKCIAKTLNEAPTGKTWNWKNPKSGNGGTVTPTSPRVNEGGRVCRNFDETVTLKDGRTEKISARACRSRDGSWSIA
jgi:surface antigen